MSNEESQFNFLSSLFNLSFFRSLSLSLYHTFVFAFFFFPLCAIRASIRLPSSSSPSLLLSCDWGLQFSLIYPWVRSSCFLLLISHSIPFHFISLSLFFGTILDHSFFRSIALSMSGHWRLEICCSGPRQAFSMDFYDCLYGWNMWDHSSSSIPIRSTSSNWFTIITNRQMIYPSSQSPFILSDPSPLSLYLLSVLLTFSSFPNSSVFFFLARKGRRMKMMLPLVNVTLFLFLPLLLLLGW